MSRAGSTQGRDEKSQKILVGKPERRNHLGDLGVDGIIDPNMGMYGPWGSAYGVVAGYCKHSNEPSSFMTGGKISTTCASEQELHFELISLGYDVTK
jgi:hypothetical protein